MRRIPFATRPQPRRQTTSTRWIAIAAISVGTSLPTLLPPALGASDASDETGAPRAQLLGRAILPAATFADGPPSGSLLGTRPIHGVTTPFSSQPLQGISSIVKMDQPGEFLALVDNGFGALENSADFRLRIYHLRIAFEPPTVDAIGFVELRDPDRKIPFTIIDDSDARILTGADFDPEALVVASDGSLWVGDEFGPFLLHFAIDGTLLDPPYSLPDPYLYSDPGPDVPNNSADSAPPLRSPMHPSTATGALLRAMLHHRAAANGNDPRPLLVSPSVDGLHFGWPADDPMRFNVDLIRRAGFPVIPWTVNDAETIARLIEGGVDGVISDYPDRLAEEARRLGAGIDLQGHRGARGLRPENSLPAMECALDHCMTTLELDLVVTGDQQLLLSHDPTLDPKKFIVTDETGTPPALPIGSLSFADIETRYRIDGTPFAATQVNDVAASPVSVAFARERRLADPYVPITLPTLLDFIPFYVDYYRSGPGHEEVDAERRATNAATVRLNAEQKIDRGQPAIDEFLLALHRVLDDHPLADRVTLQCFDHRALLRARESLDALPLSFLFPVPTRVVESSTDATPWPALSPAPLRVAISGGIESLGISPSGQFLIALLEKPLGGDTERTSVAFEFDLEKRAFTPQRWRVPLPVGAVAYSELQMIDEERAIAIARDDDEGPEARFKKIVEITFYRDRPSDVRVVADLLDIAPPVAPLDGVDRAARFTFPFLTTESITHIDGDRFLIVNDNNFPFSVGRHVASGAPDDTEFILLRIPAAIAR